MNPKVKKLLDDLQDDDGSITLSRPHFDLLINMMTPKSEEVRSKRFGKILTGLMCYGIIIYFIILAKQNLENQISYLMISLVLGFLISLLLSKFENNTEEEPKDALSSAHNALENNLKNWDRRL